MVLIQDAATVYISRCFYLSMIFLDLTCFDVYRLSVNDFGLMIDVGLIMCVPKTLPCTDDHKLLWSAHLYLAYVARD